MPKTTVLQEYELTAIEAAKAVRAFLAYEGDNKKYVDKAKHAVSAMRGYSSLRATMANEAALRIMATKSGLVPLLDGDKE